jgi:LPPG:FO 2-phospho-L-lactate transferase
MSDEPVRTIVDTEEGELPFQEYFVRRRCEPRVKGFRFEGIEKARPAPGVSAALESADGVVICPSNPWVSIDPILGVVPKIGIPVIAVSPIIAGKTIKGPAAKMYAEMGIAPSALAVADYYRDILQGFVLDSADKALQPDINMLSLVTDTLMKSGLDRARLAQDVLSFLGDII